jgi:signal transduction histidine kinase
VKSILLLVGLQATVALARDQDSLAYAKALDHLRQARYDEAFDLISDLDKQVEEASPRPYVRFLLSVVYLLDERGNYEPSLVYCFRILNLCENRADLAPEETDCLLEMSTSYYFLGLPTLSRTYAKRAERLSKLHGLAERYAEAINKMGLYYDRTGQLDSALATFSEGLTLRQKIKDTHGEAATLSNMALVHERLGNYDEALRLQLRSLAIDDSISDLLGVAWSQQMLGALRTRMGRFDEATDNLNQAEAEALRLESNELLLQTYLDKKSLLEQLSRHREALEYANKYEALRDSIHGKAILGRTALLQSAVEQDRNAQTIATQQTTLGWQRNFILLGIAFAFVISVLASFYYRSYSRTLILNREVAEQNEEIKLQSEYLIRANSDLEKLNFETAEQKEEIQAQAEELTESHDTVLKVNEHLEEMVENRTAELAQAYRELDTFFYRASHDFRRPLTTFMGLAEVAKITLKEPYALELFSKVRQTAENLDKMLMKLQSVSDVGLQQLSYKEVTGEDLIGLLYTAYGDTFRDCEISFKTDVNVISFYSYPTIIKVVLDNLVENAVQFRTTVSPFVKLGIWRKDGEILLEVSDNGQGIDEQYHDQIFNMYFRGSENSKGNGLGLYIVKKAVEKLKGRIEFESVLNEGSSFRFFLPEGHPAKN